MNAPLLNNQNKKHEHVTFMRALFLPGVIMVDYCLSSNTKLFIYLRFIILFSKSTHCATLV